MTVVWLVTPYLLLAGRVRYRALLPTALLTAASMCIASAVSVIYMPNAITTSADSTFGQLTITASAKAMRGPLESENFPPQRSF